MLTGELSLFTAAFFKHWVSLMLVSVEVKTQSNLYYSSKNKYSTLHMIFKFSLTHFAFHFSLLFRFYPFFPL